MSTHNFIHYSSLSSFCITWMQFHSTIIFVTRRIGSIADWLGFREVSTVHLRIKPFTDFFAECISIYSFVDQYIYYLFKTLQWYDKHACTCLCMFIHVRNCLKHVRTCLQHVCTCLQHVRTYLEHVCVCFYMFVLICTCLYLNLNVCSCLFVDAYIIFCTLKKCFQID